MKKITFILCLLLMACCMVFTACNRCSKPTPEPVFTGYNFDEVINADYEYIAGQEQDFIFRTVEAHFDSILCNEDENKINYMITMFQCGHMVNMIFHTPDTNRLNEIVEFIETIGTEKSYTIDTNETDFFVHLIFKDAVLECDEISPWNPVDFDACMEIAEPYREQLHTRVLTLRRFVDPRLPQNTQYIFGQGILMIDALTGEVFNEYVTYNDTILESMRPMDTTQIKE